MANDIAGIIQRKTFVGRVTYLSLVWAFTVVFGSSALALSADDVQAYLETQLGMAFGLFGPLALDAADVRVDQRAEGYVVYLDNLAFASTDLGALQFNLSIVEQDLWSVDDVSITPSSALQFNDWTWQGLWDVKQQTYLNLEYTANSLELTTSSANVSIASMALSIGEVQRGSNISERWGFNLTDLVASSGSDTPWRIAIDSFDASAEAEREHGRGAYGQIAALMQNLNVLRLAGRTIVIDDGALLGQLPGFWAMGQSLMAQQRSVIVTSQSSTALSGVHIDFPFGDFSLTLGRLVLETSVEPALSQGKRFFLQGLANALVFAGPNAEGNAEKGHFRLTLDGYDLDAFNRAAFSFMGKPPAGSTWASLMDLVSFFDGFDFEARIEKAEILSSDRQAVIRLPSAVGSVALSDMRQNEASISFDGLWRDFDAVSTASVANGEIPPALVVLGRVLRFDPLTASMLPRNGQGKLTISGLPMANVRQTLDFQPRAASIENLGGFMREAASAALVLISPFLINPPELLLSDTYVEGDGFRAELAANAVFSPISQPFFSFGSMTARFDGARTLEGIADQVSESENAKGDMADEDIVDWAGRVKNLWLKHVFKYGVASEATADSFLFDIKTTQFGQVYINDALVFGPAY